MSVYSNPLPHVLILTAIVVGIATMALALALVVRIKNAYGTVEEEELQESRSAVLSHLPILQVIVPAAGSTGLFAAGQGARCLAVRLHGQSCLSGNQWSAGVPGSSVWYVEL